jgi:hypothetical protein
VTGVFADPQGAETLAPRLLQALCESLDWDLGEFWRLDGDVLRYDAGWHRAGLDTREFDAVSRETALSRGTGLASQVWEAQRSLWMGEGLLVSPRAVAVARLGVKSGCAFPIHGPDSTPRGPGGCASWWRTRGPESRRRTARTCSSRSTRPSRREPDLDSP